MANQRLNATVSIGGTVAKSLTKGLTNTKGQLGEVGTAINKATRRQTMLSREIGKMGRQGMNVEPLRRQYAELSDEIDRLRRRQEALQRIGAADVGGKFKNMTTEVGRLARRTAMLGTAVAGGVFAVASSTAALGDDVAKTADKLGMGIEELQAYRYAAERSGVASKTFDMATQRMVRRVAEAAQGTGEAKDAIKEMGLSAQALASMTPGEQMNHFADALQSVENHGDRVRLAMKLFDSQGVALVNMLKDGSEGLRQYGEDARRTGYILSDEAARDAEVFQDTLLDTQLSLAGLKNIVGSELMPVVGEMMGKFTGWLAENRNQVREWSTMFADRLKAAVPVIGELASGIGSVVAAVGSAISKTAQLVGGFDNLGMIVGAVFAGKAIFSVGAFAVSLFKVGSALVSLIGTFPAVVAGVKAIGLALMANPIGLVVGALAAGAALIYANWSSIGPWFGKLWGGIKSVASTAWDWFKTLFSWSPLGLVIDNWGGISGWFGGLWDGITAKAEKALGWITGKLEWVGNAFAKAKNFLGFGGDDEEAAAPDLSNPPPRIGQSVQQPMRSSQGVEAYRPAGNGRQNAQVASEAVREVIITNNLTLHVSRREGEADESYARRITDMVIDELNARQQGALYDG